MKTRTLLSSVALSALVVGGTACGSNSSTPAKDADTTTTVAPATGITVTDAWARMSPAGVTKGAVYLTLTSSMDDKLLTASVEPGVAKTVEIHETVAAKPGAGDMPGAPSDGMMSDAPSTTMMGDEPMMSSDTTMPAATTMSGSGMMTMQPIESLPLPAGKAIALKPGGYHIMLIDIVEPLTVGTTIKVTLTFAKAKPMVIDVPVKEG